MKRLLAAGAPAIYQIAKAFRADEIGAQHNPEFTIVEWYRPGDDMSAGMQFLSDLCEVLFGRGPSQRLSYAEAFQQHVAVDPHRTSLAELRSAAVALDLSAPASLGDDRDGWLDFLMTERIHPHLGIKQPAIVFDFPASQAALAQIRVGDPTVGERFELYVDGIELANGYHELLDPAELRRRQADANARRRADGRAELPEESRLLAAMDAGLPTSTGVALGFDRLVMIAAGASHIREVLAFPIDLA
jgi:lysyl-tRNA synthetase class 2